MNKIMRLSRVIIVFIAVFVLSTSPFAQESQEASEKAETEMKAALGTVPVMFELYPEHLRAGAWEWFKAGQSPDAAIPPKYSELISLGTASQIPCDYCVYAHTSQAKMHGATDAEIRTAVASAAFTRHWSTVLNSADISFEDFKKEWDGILAHVKEQAEAK